MVCVKSGLPHIFVIESTEDAAIASMKLQKSLLDVSNFDTNAFSLTDRIAVSCGTESRVVQEGMPEVIPLVRPGSISEIDVGRLKI